MHESESDAGDTEGDGDDAFLRRVVAKFASHMVIGGREFLARAL
jgi:hypothetical protein